MNTHAHEADMAATTPGSFQGPDAQGRVQLSGDWTLAHATRLERALAALSAREAGVQRIDAQALGKVDTAGASLLLQLAGGAGLEQFAGVWRRGWCRSIRPA